MRAMRLLMAGALLVLTVNLIGAANVHAQELPAGGPWYEVNGADARIHLYFFWSKTCPHCQAAHPFVNDLPNRYPWLVLHSYELTEYPENAQRYVDMAASIGEQANYVPAFFVCGSLLTGYDSAATTGAELSAGLERCHSWVVQNKLPQTAALPGAAAAAAQTPAAGTAALAPADTDASGPAPAAVAGSLGAPALALPLIGEVAPAALSLPALTVVIAGLDAFNPCAFFVLMFLLSLMVYAQSRRRMLLVGGLFVLVSGLLYFVFMAAWLNLFLFVGELALITLLAGLLAMIIALINIKDFFWFRQGVSLSIPERAKPGLYQRTRGLVRATSLPAMLVGATVLAIAANSYELLCTSGFPMVYTRTLTLQDLPAPTFYLYLVAYNVIYVTPLLVIVGIFTLRFGAHKLSEQEGRVLKLLSGIMMLLLGALLVFAPALLNNLGATLLLLAATLILTVALLWIDRRWIHHRGSLKPS